MKKNESILLSVIIPVYNVMNYLERSVNSILNQKKDNIEIILVDDGSKDGSGLMCDRLALNNDIIVIHKENGGLSSARNAGLGIAKGKYIYFMDSDDMVTDSFIDIVFQKLLEGKYDVLEFRACWERKPGKYSPKISDKFTEITSIEAIDRIIHNKIGCQIWLRIYKRELFDSVSFPTKRNYEDIATICKLLINSKRVLLVDSELYVYNISNSSSITSNDNFKNICDMYWAINELFDTVLPIYKNNKDIDPIYLEYFRKHTYIYILLKLYKLHLKNNDVYTSVLTHLRNNEKYDLKKYKNYDLKRLAVYKVLNVLKKL